MIFIYKITHKETGKCYIGQAEDIKARWARHCSPSSRCKKLRNAILKYGKDAFEFKVLFECDPEVADINETIQIARHNSIEHGYNICPHGGSVMRGRNHSDEAKKKISDANRGENNPMYGKTFSDETKQKMSDAKKGKTFSDEHKKKLADAQKGEKHPNSKLSDIQREEIRNLYKTGDYTQAVLAKLYSVSQRQISNIIRGK